MVNCLEGAHAVRLTYLTISFHINLHQKLKDLTTVTCDYIRDSQHGCKFK